MLLGRCEFGKEDYSLNIVNIPRDKEEPEFVPSGPEKETPDSSKVKFAKRRPEQEAQVNLFEQDRD